MIWSMRWRVLLWAALVIGAVAAVGLGVDIVVAGPGQASVLAGIVAGFSELVAAVLAVAGWAGVRRSAAATQRAGRHGSVPEPGAPANVSRPATGTGKYVVDAHGATNVQIGDGNTQHVDARQAPPQRRRVERS